MNDLTQTEIDAIETRINGKDKLDDGFCLYFISYMAGYLRLQNRLDEPHLEATRQLFFELIKRHLDKKVELKRDFEPGQDYGTGADMQRHVANGGTWEDY